MTSEKFLAAPINNKNAKFSAGEEKKPEENGATDESGTADEK